MTEELVALSARLRATAADAAVEAGERVLAAFREGVVAEQKSGAHDLVTEHDRRTEAFLRARLTAAFPGSAVHGEEDGRVGEGEITWYVDPIDGTNNFAAGVPFFCVSIAAVAEGRVVAGAVVDPVRSEVFAADLAGASLNGRSLAAAGASCDAGALLATEFPGHRPWSGDDGALFVELVRSFGTVRRLGSGALALAYVAAGRVDVTFGVRTNPWDVAAGILLVQAAGGTYLPLPSSHAARPWEAPAYVAHVAGFDLDGSALAEVSASE